MAISSSIPVTAISIQSNCQSCHTTVNDKGTGRTWHFCHIALSFIAVVWRNIQKLYSAWRKPSLFSAKERERATPANEALTSSPVLGNCSTVYQSRRSVFSGELVWISPQLLKLQPLQQMWFWQSQSPGRGIKTQKQPTFTCCRPLSNRPFFTIALPRTQYGAMSGLW